MKCCILIFVLFNVGSADQIYPTIEIEDGKLKGISEVTDTGRTFFAFREIPYAAPPIGELRFSEPIPPQKWNYVKDATKNTKICIQRRTPLDPQIQDPRENEDCLYINVFTPKITSFKDELLPVYVYIYGGRFIAGDPTEYDFQGFIDEDIIAVIFGYRSSSLGFLSTLDGVIPENLGIRDQLLALKWVQKNINKFGGDPNKVTLGGHSSGAMSTSIHTLSAKSKGLFRSAIIQSGSALSPGYILNNTESAYSLAETFDPDIRKNDTKALLKFLRSLPAEKVARTEFKTRPPFLIWPVFTPRSPWGPVIEKTTPNSIITGPPHYNTKHGISKHIPLLIGIANEEGTTFNVELKQPLIDNNFSLILDPSLPQTFSDKNKFLEELKDFYTQTSLFKYNMTAFTRMIGDMTFAMPVISQAYLHSKFANVYFYEFSYKGPMNGLEQWKNGIFSKIPGIGKDRHGDELPFMYYYRLDNKITPSENDILIRKRTLKIWTNFIKYMNPTPSPDSLLQNISWPKVTKEDFQFVDISVNMSIKSNPHRFFEWNAKTSKYFNHPRCVY